MSSKLEKCHGEDENIDNNFIISEVTWIEWILMKKIYNFTILTLFLDL